MPKLSAYFLCVCKLHKIDVFCNVALYFSIVSFICMLLSDKSLGSHLVQTLLTLKSSVMILNTDDLLTPHIDVTSLNVQRMSVVIMSRRRNFVLYVHSRSLPDLYVSFKSHIPSEKGWCHLYTKELDTVRYFPAPSIIFWSISALFQGEHGIQ